MGRGRRALRPGEPSLYRRRPWPVRATPAGLLEQAFGADGEGVVGRVAARELPLGSIESVAEPVEGGDEVGGGPGRRAGGEDAEYPESLQQFLLSGAQ